MIFTQTFRLKLCWRWGAACSMPRVSDIDDANRISAHHILLSNCARRASHARLVACSRAIASGEARYAAARER